MLAVELNWNLLRNRQLCIYGESCLLGIYKLRKAAQTGVCFALMHAHTGSDVIDKFISSKFWPTRETFHLIDATQMWHLICYYYLIHSVVVGCFHSIFMHLHEMCRIALKKQINNMNKWYNNFIKRKFTPNESKHIKKYAFIQIDKKKPWANVSMHSMNEKQALDFVTDSRFNEITTEEWWTQPNRTQFSILPTNK